MHLVPREIDKILHIVSTGRLAQSRLARGLALNLPESTALLATVLQELVRDGKYSVAQLMQIGKTILGRRLVAPDVPFLLTELQIEATFPDGTKLITVHSPIVNLDGDLKLALYGTDFAIPDIDSFPPVKMLQDHEVPGAVIVKEGSITINDGRKRCRITVTNDGDRPIQVGSHYHFIETNPKLRFDRALAYGKRLDIAAGTAIRFEPGETKTVTLVEIAGEKIIQGGNNIASGKVDVSRLPAILENLKALGFSHAPEPNPQPESSIEPCSISRRRYNEFYGPTVGDRVKLGDSELWIEIEKDYTVYGDECVFGGGKVIRDGMGQKAGAKESECLDLVITNAVIIDYTGIYKADIGIKNGYISGIGKSGNPDIMANVTPGMVIGACTEVLSAEGHIITAGAVDTHIHFICPQQCYEALSSGITTMIGGGTGPNTGTKATTCTPGSRHIEFMLRSTDDLPLNFGFTGKGNSSVPEDLHAMVEAGAIGLKLHEDYGTTPAAIDSCLSVCDKYDIQTTIHTDTLNESGFVETTIKAFKNRTIHAYHTEGAGGGHAPDILTVIGQPNVIPSSTNPTRPYTKNTIDEHLDMLMVCHHLDSSVPEDIAFAESRIRSETIGAEDILHDQGAISIISSDSQAMGRIGEVITRTWQTADKMKKKLGYLSEKGETEKEGHADNFRVKRYVAKYTINPAIAHGASHVIGSVEVGKLADLVMYKPAYFGTKPEVILKGGYIVSAMMGDPNASIPTPQPVFSRPQFGSFPSILSQNCIAFVSKASITSQRVTKYGLKKTVVGVKNCRKVGKLDMKHNNILPKVEVDPETYVVTVNGISLSMGPAEEVCMGQSVIF